MINRSVDRSRPPAVSPISSEPSFVPHAGWRFLLFFRSDHGNTGANYQNRIFQKYALFPERKSIPATLEDRGRGGCQSLKLTRLPRTPVPRPPFPNFTQGLETSLVGARYDASFDSNTRYKNPEMTRSLEISSREKKEERVIRGVDIPKSKIIKEKDKWRGTIQGHVRVPFLGIDRAEQDRGKGDDARSLLFLKSLSRIRLSVSEHHQK